MRIVVIGGSGLIGSKLVKLFRDRGDAVVSASPAHGVDTLTGEGPAEAVEGASAVIDVSESGSFDDAAARAFFETSTRNLFEEEAAAGVGDHVALSVVGRHRLAGSGYFRAEVAQEKVRPGKPAR
jgi:uncharacterized protein YbjT (DUF2867 family)